LNLKLYKEKELLLETEAKLNKRSPLVIKGPQVGGGTIAAGAGCSVDRGQAERLPYNRVMSSEIERSRCATIKVTLRDGKPGLAPKAFGAALQPRLRSE